jgi:uncharacterized protein YndB with AHSA1/START domain
MTVRIEKSIEIAASSEQIWPYLVEPEKFLKWWFTVQEYKPMEQPLNGLDSTFYVEEKCAGPLMKLNFEVTEWEENRSLAFRMASGSGVKAYAQKWAIEATQAGSKFILYEEWEAPFGIFGKISEVLLRSSSENLVEQYLSKLKNLIEA